VLHKDSCLARIVVELAMDRALVVDMLLVESWTSLESSYSCLLLLDSRPMLVEDTLVALF
jgi:hypothetical protein